METNPTGLPEMTLTRVINAPLELLWEVWTNPHHIAQWWGPQGFTNPICEWEAQDGKKIFINMIAPDGSSHPIDGEFKEVVKPERLVFITAKTDNTGNRIVEIINTVNFTSIADKTRITIHAKVLKAPQAFLEGMGDGWNTSMDKLENYIQDKINEFKFHI